MVARIAAIDAAASTVTLTGSGGRSAALQVDKDVLARLKVGDLVHATYTEALAVALTRDGGR